MNGRLVALKKCAPRTGSPTALPIAALSPGPLTRTGGTDDEHVLALAAVFEQLPPIVVHEGTLHVVDGLHRVDAAKLRGHTHIEALLVEGNPTEIFFLAVELKARNGRPLTRRDRRTTVHRILELRPMWSDRRIARLAGVSPTTVATARRSPTTRTLQSDIRLGLDGRRRPMDVAQRRLQAEQLFTERPQSTLRHVAAAVGISLATAHDVRRRMNADASPGERNHHRTRTQDRHGVRPPRQWTLPGQQKIHPGREKENNEPRSGHISGQNRTIDRTLSRTERPANHPAGHGPDPGNPDPTTVLQSLLSDPSLRSTLVGRSLLRLLTAQCLDAGRIEGLLRGIPPHRRSTVSALARHCGRSWLYFADRIEQEPGPQAG
ncbi:MAG: hypothetical protein QG608_2229 [Actinomycetota bacterium]|nr:hypothetical protein [Actinomycetota bacterium]